MSYINAEELMFFARNHLAGMVDCNDIARFPKADVVEVVRCQNCVHAQPFDRNCELSTSAYMHCSLWRGEETKNVWHKYKKYYKDYSVVDRDGFCDAGEKEAT